MIIKVFEVTGVFAVGRSDGERLYELAQPPLLEGEKIELDFTDVMVFSSAFFNYAIAQLLRDLDPNSLNRLLGIKNIPAWAVPDLQKIIDLAKKYYYPNGIGIAHLERDRLEQWLTQPPRTPSTGFKKQ